MTEVNDIGHDAVVERQERLRDQSFKASFDAEGKLTLHKREVRKRAPVKKPALSVSFNKAAVAVKMLEVGDKMADKTIYAGELDGKKIFAAPEDAPLTMMFNEAADYAVKLNQENYLGHNDWRVPTHEELNVLHENKDKGALKDTFNLTGSDFAGWYWSSTSNDNFASQRFSDSTRTNVYNRNTHMSVRLVC